MPGWVKLSQDIFNDEDIVSDDTLFKTWIFCLVSAAYQPTKIKIKVGRGYREMPLLRGQFILQRNISSKTIKLSPERLRNNINKLSQLGKITKKSTNQFSVISIVNYDSYNGTITMFTQPKQESPNQNNVFHQPKTEKPTNQKEEEYAINLNSLSEEEKNNTNQTSLVPPTKNENSTNQKILPIYVEYNNIELLSLPQHSFINNFYLYIKSKFGNKCPKLTYALIQKSYDTLDKLTRIDGFEFDYIHDVLVFAHKDKFWNDKVLSLTNIRVKGKDGLTKFQKIAMSYERYKEKNRTFGKNYNKIKEMFENGEKRLEGVSVGDGTISW